MTIFNFGGMMGTPGQSAPVEEVVSAYGLCWGPLGIQRFLPVQIDGSARDAGNTGYTSVLRPNLLLGRIASSGKYMQWDPTATDGTQKISGILMHPMEMTLAGTNKDKFVGYVLFGGAVNARALAQASSASSGISGTTYEYLIRSQLYPYFQLDDDPMGYYSEGSNNPMILSASATLGTAHLGQLIVVRGASGAVTLTLPATPSRGLRFRVYNASNQNLSIVAGTADTMVVYNDLTADSVTLSTAGELIGGGFEIIGDGTGWLVLPMLWEGQTPTIAT